jgi:hypothetical protein
MYELAGKRFGRLLVIERFDRRRWRCRCDCGTLRDVLTQSLTDGRTQSCGCLQRERAAKAQHKHGYNRREEGRPKIEYRIWQGIKCRCLNPKVPLYKFYGGRGILLCERWMEFANFLADVGNVPAPGLTIERIDNNGHYEPGNIWWATRTEQARNRRSTKYIEHAGERLSLAEWAERLHVPYKLLWARLARGVPFEQAIVL